MAETYAATYDANVRAPVPVYEVTVSRHDLEPPWYLPPTPPPSKARGRAKMQRLARLVPGSVRGYDA